MAVTTRPPERRSGPTDNHGSNKPAGLGGRGAFVAACLVGTVFIGAALRWVLAGWGLPWGSFERWRHAHSHLGYYGILFPLMWAAWSASGWPALSRWAGWAYGVGVVLATVGFVRAGYGPEAIVGSTLVGAMWVLSAVRSVRAGANDAAPWLRSTPWAIFLGCCCVPLIAVFTRRDPSFAAQLVRTFLALLLLGGFVPSALGSLRLRAPSPWLWLAASATGSAFVGIAPYRPLGIGLVLLGGMVFWALWRARGRCPWDVWALWAGFAAGLVGMGCGALPNVHPVAIAAVHFAVLGPLLVTPMAQLPGVSIPPVFRWLYGFLVMGMVLSIALMALSPSMGLALSAAAFGSAAALALTLGVIGIFAFRTRSHRGR